MEVYGSAGFTPAAITKVIQTHEKTKISLVQDKSATPAEGPQPVESWDASLRPQHIVNERSTTGQSNVQENYAAVFAKFGDLHITSGSTMVIHIGISPLKTWGSKSNGSI